MPQLDQSTFSLQSFSICFFFLVFYFICRFMILPQINKSLKMRELLLDDLLLKSYYNRRLLKLSKCFINYSNLSLLKIFFLYFTFGHSYLKSWSNKELVLFENEFFKKAHSYLNNRYLKNGEINILLKKLLNENNN